MPMNTTVVQSFKDWAAFWLDWRSALHEVWPRTDGWNNPLYFYLNTYSRVLHSEPMRDSLCKGQWLTQRLTHGQSTENNCQSSVGTCISYPGQRFRNHQGRGLQKIFKAIGWGGPEWSGIFWTWRESCTHSRTHSSCGCLQKIVLDQFSLFPSWSSSPAPTSNC